MSETDLALPWLNISPTLANAGAARDGVLRFAFYGRVSTEDQQEAEASRLWQRGRAEALLAPAGGSIVADYFDIGESRALPWKRRPRAQALLSALADRNREFNAVVIGEPQRAFYSNQFGDTFPLFVHYEVPLRVPEVGGAIDGNNETHDLIMSVFGGMPKGERNRIKVRVPQKGSPGTDSRAPPPTTPAAIRTVTPAPGPRHGVKRARHPYLLRGALICDPCERKMHGRWSHEHAYYRCRYPSEYGLANRVQHPRNVYVREAWIVRPLDNWLGKMFLPHRIDNTIDLMTAAAETGHPHSDATTQARAEIADCDAKLTQHRAALEARADPELVTQWISQTQARRAQAQARLRSPGAGGSVKTSRDSIADLLRAAGDLTRLIHQAAPEDKTEIYRKLGLQLRYHPGQQKVLVEAHLDQHIPDTRGVSVCVRGGCRAMRTMSRRWPGGRWCCRRPPGTTVRVRVSGAGEFEALAHGAGGRGWIDAPRSRSSSPRQEQHTGAVPRPL
ncbi:recombinase family protein [Streptomyces oryzae]|uniref:recombinase family protein n=1 Tax=Streptomyces oryzae TaxID=1434886 RepID=UPI001ADC4E3C|nr:recombinase family protein [Streptomyces oryzae]